MILLKDCIIRKTGCVIEDLMDNCPQNNPINYNPKQFNLQTVKMIMEVFNIKIGYGKNELTLTILPTKEGYYKVIYYGGILGAVRLDNHNETWEKVPDEEIEPGDLPLYQHNLNADRLDIVLDEHTVHRIGEEIIAA